MSESLTANYELVSHTEEMGQVKANIKVNEYSTDNRLLNLVIPVAEIIGFRQVIPSMNDIFIQVVQEYNKTHRQS